MFDNPKYREECAKTGAPVETISTATASCARNAKGMIELAEDAADGEEVKKALGADLVIPALALGFAAYFSFPSPTSPGRRRPMA